MSQPYPFRNPLISERQTRLVRPLVEPGRRDTASDSAPSDSPPAIVSLIGDTPLVPLTRCRWSLTRGVSVLLKLEGHNPGGSVKDRAALSIVREAQARGSLRPGKTLLDATSGNTGIAYAMLGAALRFPVRLALPADVSPERLQILRAYGAELTLTDPADGTDGARSFVHGLAGREPDRYYCADQYSNPANPQAHYDTTGPEIWRETRWRLTHLVAGLGTGGTMTGVGTYLKERNPRIQLVGVQPDSPRHGISGLKHLATASPPGIYDPGLADRLVNVATPVAETMARWLARREGLFVGISSGAALAATLEIAQHLDHGLIVAILPDGGFKYTSAAFWAV